MRVKAFPRARARGPIEAHERSNGVGGGGEFPRARARGPIEACSCVIPPRVHLHFHERALVAPLKQQDGGAADRELLHFHERALVAPLKPESQHRYQQGLRISTSARSWPH